jgi:hypothetical protein
MFMVFYLFYAYRSVHLYLMFILCCMLVLLYVECYPYLLVCLYVTLIPVDYYIHLLCQLYFSFMFKCMLLLFYRFVI